MIRRSIISSAAGTMPAAMIPDTASLAASTDSKTASSVRTSSGTGISRSVARVTIPNVPSAPTAIPTRS